MCNVGCIHLTGWGTTEFTGPKSNVLLKTDVNVVDPMTCASKTGGNADQMCTYKAGHDACQVSCLAYYICLTLLLISKCYSFSRLILADQFCGQIQPLTVLSLLGLFLQVWGALRLHQLSIQE